MAPLSKGGRFVAAILSLLAPGAGQAYAGRVGRGLALAVGGAVIGRLSLEGMLALPSFWSLLLPFLVVMGYRVWASLQAYRDRYGTPNRFIINRLGNALLVVIVTYAVSLLIGAPRLVFSEQAYHLPSNSMSPLLLSGDYLITRPLRSEPKRGQVVVFLRPDDTTKSYVKRLIAGPGDTIEMRDRRVFLNNRPLAEPYAHYEEPDWDPRMDAFNWQRRYLVGRRADGYTPSRHTWGPLLLTANSWFVMGDDRDNSADSRFFGFVPRFLIVGEPRRVYFSADSLRRIRWSRLGKAL